MSKILLSLVLMTLSVISFGQKGSIQGLIADAKTGEELIGANAIITNSYTGDMADIYGKYKIENLIEGTYSITFSFVSYADKTINNIIVKAGQITTVNVALDEASITLQEVVVVARVSKRTENALMAIKRKAVTAIDGISSQQMATLGASDAAAALSKVTGITVQGGKYVYVRGLSDRYSKTLLNNAEIPGLDPEKNTVQMDMFPSNIIQNMMVHKTYSANLPGSFTGGLIDVETIDFPEDFNLNLSATFSYNPQSNLNDNFLTGKRSSTDWLGFDDGLRSIPELAAQDIPSRYQNDVLLNQITKSFNKDMAPINRKSGINQSYSLAFGDNSKLFGRKFGYNAALSYSHKYKYSDNGAWGRYKLADKNASVLNTEQLYNNTQKGVDEVFWSALMNFSYKISENHTIGLLGLKNQSGEFEAGYSKGIKNTDDVGMIMEIRKQEYVQRSLMSGQAKGDHKFGDLSVKWLSSYTKSNQDQPDQRYFKNSINNGKYELESSKYEMPSRYYRNMWEINFDNKLDLTYSFKINDKDSKIQAGGAYLKKERDFAENKFTFTENSSSFNGSISDWLADENMDVTNDGVFVQGSKQTNDRNSYTASQTLYSGYAMADIELIKKFRTIIGFRVENTDLLTQSYSAKKQDGQIINTDILPSFNGIYAVNDKMNLRMSYSRTLARPSFREIAPYASTNFATGEVEVGNPNLKISNIDNIDIKWEFYFNQGELISINPFYKAFHSPIEQTFNTEAANVEITWSNLTDLANVYGVELEFRKKLDFVPLLSDFIIGSNLTIVQSQIQYGEKELAIKQYLDANQSTTRQMAGQAPYIVNAYISYDNKNLGLNANLSYTTNGKKLFLVNSKNIPDIYELGMHNLDFNVSKTMMKDKLKVKFGVSNILDAKHKYTYDFKNTEYVYNNYGWGRSFSVGLSYTIK